MLKNVPYFVIIENIKFPADKNKGPKHTHKNIL